MKLSQEEIVELIHETIDDLCANLDTIPYQKHPKLVAKTYIQLDTLEDLLTHIRKLSEDEE